MHIKTLKLRVKTSLTEMVQPMERMKRIYNTYLINVSLGSSLSDKRKRKENKQECKERKAGEKKKNIFNPQFKRDRIILRSIKRASNVSLTFS